jgi:hypothetical protein
LLKNPQASKDLQNKNNYASPLVHHLYHHSPSSMFMSSFTKQDERPQSFPIQRMSTIIIYHIARR